MTLQEQMKSPAVLKAEPLPVKLKDQMEDKGVISDPREGLCLAEKFVKKFYLDDLDKCEITKPSRKVKELSLESNLILYKITGLVFSKDEKVQDRLNNVYSAMHGLNLSVVFMLVSNGKSIDFFIGTKSENDDFFENAGLAKAFEKAFTGNFPGSVMTSVSSNECNSMLNRIMPASGENAISSLTSLPSLKDDEVQNNQYIQGMEKFVDAMQGEDYSVIIISDPVSGGQIEQMKQGYEELYSEIAPLAEYSLTLAENKGINISNSEMKGYTDTIGKSVSKTQSFTKGTSITKSESTTNTFGVGIGMMGNMGSMSSDSTNISKNILTTFGSTVFGGPVAMAAVSGLSQAIGGNFGLNASKAKQNGASRGKSESRQVGIQDTEQKSHAVMSQQTIQKGVTTGTSTSSMVKYENKLVKGFLECIDAHLKRLKECENYGMWSSAAYFISPSKETLIISASTYKGIINGEGTSLESASINTWFKDETTKSINAYLRHFTHPRFHDKDFLIDLSATPDITPSTMLSTKELSVQCSVPYKSIPGVYVREMAGFGRNIYDADEKEEKLRIGQIYHMGKVYQDHVVNLQLNRLREHTFITGSTGSGKSNTTYEIIARLNGLEEKGKLNGESLKNRIPTLVIEPAKGEYKQIFGDSFNVFGTNPDYMELLRINPFKFEEKIHVLEHIDKLIDIFNVCWPMYAAMPAVLKEAVEDAYKRCGWNMKNSTNSYGYDIYPNFGDLLVSLRNVIKSSEYSQEVKDNYTGSLITRVKSLTNGLNGQIFTSDEVDNHRLFDESTIIDLSRIGSSETKSLLMGIIVMRLQERRMAAGGINLPLQHVTILEEAHNLLKKTSPEESAEGFNLQGKSVEMISNAIAEMRTYGEGFIIVDQAPGLLDMSAIRNTNTKIIFHLPDMGDRELVGRAAGLSDDQLTELAKIPSGVAAIYQNRWVEPVLCNVDYYNIQPTEYFYSKETDDILDNAYIRAKVASHLVSIISGQNDNINVRKLKHWLISSDIDSATKLEVLKILDLKSNIKKTNVEKIIANIVDRDKKAFEIAKDADSIEEWNETLIRNLDMDISVINDTSIENILECLIHYRSLEHASDEENFFKWMNYMGRRRL